MNDYGLALLALAALLTFWLIGAYNRLVAMRNDIAQAWAKVGQTLEQRAAVVQPLAQALRQPMAAEQGALDTWLAAHAEAARTATRLSARAVDEAAAQAWVNAESTLAAASSRVLALLDQHKELRQQDQIAALATAWQEAQSRLPFARQLFNEVAQPYNEALTVFPTPWVAASFKLRRAGLI